MLDKVVQQRRALCIGIGTFPSQTQNAWRQLPFAGERAIALEGALTRLGYKCTRLDDPSAASLGQAVHDLLDELGSDDVLIVHVLSHGTITGAKALQVVGAEGQSDWRAEIEVWLRRVTAEQSAPLTLFLIDLCHSGKEARHQWETQIDSDGRRAWVIAACDPDEAAYHGRFTQATTNVLAALADGVLDVDPSLQYAPISTLAQRIRREVAQLVRADDGLPQRVTASLVDISSELSDLPFFVNARFSPDPRQHIRSVLDAGVVPFFDDLDEALDPAHFIARAAGHGVDFAQRGGSFSGRAEELRDLSPWVNLQGSLGVRVVTGSPGVGKSALIGVLVCAAHPGLREFTRNIWDRVAQQPYVNRHLAAVHARQRTTQQVIDSIARQLGFKVPKPGSAVDPESLTAAELIAAVIDAIPHPVVIVDALDEAIDGSEIMEQLLLPMAQGRHPDGEPVRLLVGVRPWAEFGRLRHLAERQGGLVDLDAVPTERLRGDVAQYVSRLLTTDPKWDSLERVGATHTVARAVAETLTGTNERRELGAFLAAGLFAYHLLNAYPDGLSDQEAFAVGRSVPHTLPDLLDLDLESRSGNPLLRPILRALAHGHGDGMPAEIIRYVARAASPVDALAAIEEIRFYLRHRPGGDGMTRYRLFHQGLADHLRKELGAREVLDGLLASVTPTAGRPRWDLAEQYVRQYVVDHAADAGRLEQLLTDAEFLLRCDLDTVRRRLDDVRGTERKVVQAFVEAAAKPAQDDPVHRRHLLSLLALRPGGEPLRRSLKRTLWPSDAPWRPRWMAEGAYTCGALAFGGELALLGRADGTVEVRSAADGRQRLVLVGAQPTRITALAAGEIRGRRVLCAATDTRTLRLWAIDTGDPILPDLDVPGPLDTILIGGLGDRPVIVGGSGDGPASIWDADTGRPVGSIGDGVLGTCRLRTATALLELRRRHDPDDALELLADGEPLDLPLGDHWFASAAALGTAGVVPLLYTGDADGTIRAWRTQTAEAAGTFTLSGAIDQLAAGLRGEVLAIADGMVCTLELVSESRADEAVPRQRNARTVAIDFGTTNTLVSVIQDDLATVIPNAEGSRSTPSLVAFGDGGELLVGHAAERQARTDPQSVVHSIKRSIGTKQRFDVSGHAYTAQELAARVLMKLKRDAEAQLREPITGGVITVPTHFDIAQRSAMQEAGAIAGFEELRIISDSTAAALAYGLEPGVGEQTVLVVDVGGGYSSSAVIVMRTDGHEVRSASGNDGLGGEAWNERIGTHLIDAFRAQHGIDLLAEPAARYWLREAAEKAKIELSTTYETSVTLPDAISGFRHPRVRVTRTEFERMSLDLLERLKLQIQQTIAESGVGPAALDRVILSGGSTRMAAVVELIKHLAGQEPYAPADRNEAVTVGAAKWTGMLKRFFIADVVALPLYVRVDGGAAQKVVGRNTPIPVSRTVTCITSVDGQRAITVNVYQGEGEESAHNRHLETIELVGLAALPSGFVQIELTFDIDADGIGHVAAKDADTGREQPILITRHSRLPKDELERMKRVAQGFADEDRRVRREVELRRDAETLERSAERLLSVKGDLSDDARGQVVDAVTDLHNALGGSDVGRIRAAYDTLSRLVRAR
ncbi:Hsp70 family protein [Dactylosporangium sp. NPDC048998]|uniref:Hsp70 family protein n=1 Tax=Dactylosporangium sp. NPDC048998 TaxID=3363976 RepID=UPI003714BA71